MSALFILLRRILLTMIVTRLIAAGLRRIGDRLERRRQSRAGYALRRVADRLDRRADARRIRRR